jgi:hypothetical protein
MSSSERATYRVLRKYLNPNNRFSLRFGRFSSEIYARSSKIPSLESNSIKASSEIYCVLRSSMQEAVRFKSTCSYSKVFYTPFVNTSTNAYYRVHLSLG